VDAATGLSPVWRRAARVLRDRRAAAGAAHGGDAPQDAFPDLEPEFRALHARCAPFSMTSTERMYALWQAVRHVQRAGLPGDYVECGVWRGGSSMLAGLAFASAGGHPRRLWLYDTFEGMTEPSERDRAFDSESSIVHDWDEVKAEGWAPLLAASLEEVRANLVAAGIGQERVEYVVGRVEETIPSRAPEAICLLRLDTDWYESTRHELEHLYPRLVPGGVLIVDDYGHWAGAREAVDEYFGDRADAPLLTRIDYTGRIAVKR
jgi:O-methyltransferase